VKPEVLIVSGVSGAGKTRLGCALAAELGWDFADADDYHSEANVAKMRAGTPLDDGDRAPWLAALRVEIERRFVLGGRPLVLACSALKKSHRDVLVGGDGGRVRLLFLDGPRELITERLVARAGHYMPAALLDSQLAALERPAGALRIDVADTTEAQVAAVRAALGV
jgi:gluconokinase